MTRQLTSGQPPIAPFASREASAAGRLCSNGVLGQIKRSLKCPVADLPGPTGHLTLNKRRTASRRSVENRVREIRYADAALFF
jgi:hypothetical protein